MTHSTQNILLEKVLETSLSPKTQNQPQRRSLSGLHAQDEVWEWDNSEAGESKLKVKL